MVQGSICSFAIVRSVRDFESRTDNYSRRRRRLGRSRRRRGLDIDLPVQMPVRPFLRHPLARSGKTAFVALIVLVRCVLRSVLGRHKVEVEQGGDDKETAETLHPVPRELARILGLDQLGAALALPSGPSRKRRRASGGVSDLEGKNKIAMCVLYVVRRSEELRRYMQNFARVTSGQVPG